MEMRPKISICIPTYNRANLLKQVIECALDQTTSDSYEVLVVDNASTDNTQAAVEAYGDPRLRYQRNQTNLGMTRNWNRCLKLARGDYITIWHDDDVYFPDLLAAEADVFDRYPEVGFVYCAYSIIDETGKAVGEVWPFPSFHVWSGDKELSFLNRKCYPVAPMMRRRHLHVVGPFKPELKYAPDWEMWLRFALHGDVGYVHKILSGYRVHAQRTTTSLSAAGFNMAEEECAALDSAFTQALSGLERLRGLKRRGYCEIVQRHLLQALFAYRGGRRDEAKHELQEAWFALAKKARWYFLPYSLWDGICFLRKRLQGRTVYIFSHE